MKVTKLFSRKLSCIDNIQKEKVLEYYISEKIQDGVKIYGIFVNEFGRKTSPEDNSVFISPDHSKVCEILKFLYENAIDSFGFRDILKELSVF